MYRYYLIEIYVQSNPLYPTYNIGPCASIPTAAVCPRYHGPPLPGGVEHGAGCLHLHGVQD